MKEIKVILMNDAGCTFDCNTFNDADSAVAFCKNRGGEYTAVFEQYPYPGCEEFSITVKNTGNRNSFYISDYARQEEVKITVATLVEKLNSLK